MRFEAATDDQEGGVGDDQDNLPGPLIGFPLWIIPFLFSRLDSPLLSRDAPQDRSRLS